MKVVKSYSWGTSYLLFQTLSLQDVGLSFCHNARRHRETDGRTDDRMMPIADHTDQWRSQRGDMVFSLLEQEIYGA